MAAYIVMIRDKMLDETEFETYGALAREARGERPPKALAFYGAHENLEGLPAEGVVVLEFPDLAAAHAWYDSPAYRAAKAHRVLGADYRVLLVEGVPPKTPG